MAAHKNMLHENEIKQTVLSQIKELTADKKPAEVAALVRETHRLFLLEIMRKGHS